jgi:hypothetical protein
MNHVCQGYSHSAIIYRQRQRMEAVRIKREERAARKARRLDGSIKALRLELPARTEIARARQFGELAGVPLNVEDDGGSWPVDSGMPDSMIRGLAKTRVKVMEYRIGRLSEATNGEDLRQWLNAQVEPMNGKPFPKFNDKTDHALQLAGMLARSVCPLWWRRHLRRAVVTLREDEGQRYAEVHARGQIYCTDDTVARRIEQNQRNAETLEATEIEDEAGQVITLAQAAGAGVANKGIRRGELMTRIRGCEEWAEANGMAGLFTTNTLPSRFHRMTQGKKGQPCFPNPKWDGSGPRDGQAWLCKAWARTRAQLDRLGLPFFGFRVAEPHHDGCPHWHMLLWTAPEFRNELRRVIRNQWLRDEGDEPGAKRYRFSGKKMRAGGAAGYIAKYIAKNIDDESEQVAGALDPATGSRDLFGGNVAKRVEAWAAARRIRQFQAIGQPPVTVWRELRRIKAETVLMAPEAVRLAHDAVHRDGEKLANWRAYMDAQGGAMTGRAYRVRMLTVEVKSEGRYEPVTQDKPAGVYAASEPARVYRSERREWRPRGEWARPVVSAPNNPHPVYLLEGGAFVPNPAHGLWITEGQQREAKQAHSAPRTRLNNCTEQGGAADLLAALTARISGVPGGNLKETQCPAPLPKPNPPPLPSCVALNRSPRA